MIARLPTVIEHPIRKELASITDIRRCCDRRQPLPALHARHRPVLTESRMIIRDVLFRQLLCRTECQGVFMTGEGESRLSSATEIQQRIYYSEAAENGGPLALPVLFAGRMTPSTGRAGGTQPEVLAWTIHWGPSNWNAGVLTVPDIRHGVSAQGQVQQNDISEFPYHRRREPASERISNLSRVSGPFRNVTSRAI